MKRSGKHIVTTIFAVGLTILVIVMEFSLRLAEPFSPAAFSYIQALIKNHPHIFAALWIVILGAAMSVAYVKYVEKKTAAKLAALLIWLAIFLTGLLYWLYQLFETTAIK